MDRIRILWCWADLPCMPHFFPSDKADVHILKMMTSHPVSEEELIGQVNEADFIVVRRYIQITRSVIKAAKRLRMIQKMGRMVENIDVEAAKQSGIPVCILPMSLDMAVAEHAIMFMLALPKRLIQAHYSVVNGDYEKFGLSPATTTERTGIAECWTQLPGDNIYHKTLGIIGMGDIGMAVAQRAKSFEMAILYYKRKRLNETEERRLGIQYTSLHDLLKRSDFVSLHLPHIEETNKMIGRRELAMMKPTAYLINTSRGGIIDEMALCDALKCGVIAGAGLDVFEKEPTPKGSPLLELDNVILTPHNAALWPNGPNIAYDVRRASENIFSVVQGGKPLHGSRVV